MPTYIFRHTELGEIFEFVMRMSEYDEFVKNNPILEPIIQRPNFVSMVGDVSSRQSDGFREVLSKVAEAHPMSPLADKVHRRSIKEVKTKQLLDKHLKNDN